MKKLLAIIMAVALCVMALTRIHHHTLAGKTCTILTDLLLHADCDGHGRCAHHQGGACSGCSLDVEAVPESSLKADVFSVCGRLHFEKSNSPTHLFTNYCGVPSGHLYFGAVKTKTTMLCDISISQTNPFHRHLKKRGPPEIDC